MGQKVTVYNFRRYNIMTDENVLSKRRGLLSSIERIDGSPILESAAEVDLDDLDGDGFERLPTGTVFDGNR